MEIANNLPMIRSGPPILFNKKLFNYFINIIGVINNLKWSEKECGGPEGVRTLDLTVKSRLLYLAKLRAHLLADRNGLDTFRI